VVGTTTITAASNSTIISNTINTVSVFGPNYCSWSYWNITIEPGTSEVSGTIGPSSYKIGFYIMNHQQFTDLKSEASVDCSGPFPGEVVVESLTSAYSLDWANPPAGSYYVVFFNSGGASFPIATPFFLVATSAQEQTSTIYSVAAAEVTVPATETVTTAIVQQLAQPGNISGLNPEIIGGIIVAVVAVAAALYFVRSKQRKPVEGTRVYDQATVTLRQESDKKFCINCRKQIPAGSKFCNECGADQD